MHKIRIRGLWSPHLPTKGRLARHLGRATHAARFLTNWHFAYWATSTLEKLGSQL